GHEGFLLTPEEAAAMTAADPRNAELLFPFMTGNDLLTTTPPRAKRYVIDFHPRDRFEAQTYAAPFERVRTTVLPDREAKAREEAERNEEKRKTNPKASVNRHHASFLNTWWQLSSPRGEMKDRLAGLGRFIACPQVMKRPTFAFVSTDIRPNAALIAFPLEDDYSFGVLQSGLHWAWFTARCSTLTERFRYTTTTVWDSFPWPQAPTLEQALAVAEAA